MVAWGTRQLGLTLAAAPPLPHVPRKILKTMSWLKKFPAKYCIQDVYRQNIEPKRLRGCQGCQGGVGDPLGNAVWQFEGLHYLHQTYRRHERAGAPGAADPALQSKYGHVEQRGQVTKVGFAASILLPLPERE